MHERLVVAVFTVIVVLSIAVSPVGAITGDWVEDFDHPFVGLVVFYNTDGEFIWRCSGSLLADKTTFLTAGHCADTAEGAASARVHFQQDAGANYDPALGYDPVTGYPEFCAGKTKGKLCATSDELYNYGFANFAGFPNTRDVGLVILDQRISLPEYGQLPAVGVLDDLDTSRGQNDTVFTVSGYGLSYRTNANDPLPDISFRERLMATSTLLNLESSYTDGYNLQTQGHGNDRGGTCSGDSGGPVFLGDPDLNVIVAVTSFGIDAMCRGTDYSYRVDRQEVLDWIANPE